MLQSLPIRLKLMLIAMLATGGALLLAGTVLISFESSRTRREMERDLETLADLVAQNSIAPLEFHDQSAAAETLGALKARKAIVAAALYDRQGRLFASYQRRGEIAIPSAPGRDGSEFQPGALVAFSGVVFKGERLGTIYLRSSLDEL